MNSIPYGTDPSQVVEAMALEYVNPEFLKGRRKVHWSAVPIETILEKTSLEHYLEVAKRQPITLALWRDQEKVVVAWIDISEV